MVGGGGFVGCGFGGSGFDVADGITGCGAGGAVLVGGLDRDVAVGGGFVG